MSDNAEIATLGALYADTESTLRPLSDFRVQEFTHNPSLIQLKRGAKVLTPYLGAVVVSTIVMYAALFLINQWELSKLRAAMRSEIESILPNTEVVAGSEIATVMKEIDALDEQLNELGSPSTYSPFDALLELSKSFPKGSSIDIKKVDINGKRVQLSGSGENYSAVESFVAAMSKHDHVFCKVDQKNSSGKRFNVELTLC